jgi:hypothetical protein
MDVDTQIKLTLGTQYVENLLLKQQLEQTAAALADAQKWIDAVKATTPVEKPASSRF